MLKGVDVSSYQGALLWPQLKQDLDLSFVIVKACEGNKPQPDPLFEANVLHAKAAGLIVGAYHFVYPLPPAAGIDYRSPQSQAALHFSLSDGFGSKEGDLPPFIDFEWPEPKDFSKWGCSPSQMRNWILDYLDTAASLWGCMPILYTYPDFWSRIQGPSEPLFAKKALLWQASYLSIPAHLAPVEAWPTSGPKEVFKPWGEAAFWQWTDEETFPTGLKFDLDAFNGTTDDLVKLTHRSGGLLGDLHPELVTPDPEPDTAA